MTDDGNEPKRPTLPCARRRRSHYYTAKLTAADAPLPPTTRSHSATAASTQVRHAPTAIMTYIYLVYYSWRHALPPIDDVGRVGEARRGAATNATVV